MSTTRERRPVLAAGSAGQPQPARASLPASPSTRHPHRAGPALAALALGVLLAALAAVCMGAAGIAPADALGAIAARLGLGTTPLDAVHDAIVVELRLPRVLTAVAVGGGLAVVGVLMQALTRNPLADPYLLGVSSGASLGAVAVLVLGVTVVLPAAAFGGALAALVATLALAGGAGGATPTRTVLAGVVVGSVAAAIVSLVIIWRADGDAYREILAWLLGSLASASWQSVAIAGSGLLLVMPLLATGRILDAFAFGDAAATALGIPANRARWILLVVAALVTGALVSVAGAIGFLGLVVPHAARLLVGARHALVLPTSALTGALVLVVADTIARSAFEPRELPVGIVTALLGAPAFAALLLTGRVRA